MTEQRVLKELETIKGMVVAWKESYIGFVQEGGGGEFLVQDLMNEIEDYVSPYIHRLYQCNYIDARQVRRFMDFCYRQVQELREVLKEEG